MPSISSAATTKNTTTLTVAVRCRALTEGERQRGRDIVRVNGNKEVVVLDPDLSKDYLDLLQNRTKERNYSFDYAFGPECSNSDVYRRCVFSTIAGVIQGLNATIFAYGSTGSGKTHTMVGTQNDPGLMVLSLHTIFDFIRKDNSPGDFEVTCSYVEVYNEVIYDLLEKSSGHLELREDPEQGVIIAGLRSIKVHSADKILELLNLGNSRRKTESTEANATSSRSHAVLEITVKRKQKINYRSQILKGKLALVDLAGSERASETNSGGQKLRDGANINRSLLSLANCINALGKHHKKGLAYVPYRNSKLTRILKDGLSGNSQTIMVATISPSHRQYHHTINTLKYADRAKEIRTHIQKNFARVDTHVSDYQRMIDNLQVEVCRLKKELAEKESQLSVKPVGKSADDELSWLNILSQEISENVQERINLQKALFELEETNLRNRTELRCLDEAISKQEDIENEVVVMKTLRERRQLILDNIRDNDEAGADYQKEIENNEKQRCQLQEMIDEAIKNNGNRTYLHILSKYRLLVMANTELQFEIAMRDQVIHDQREAHKNLWNLLLALGLDERRLLEHAAKEGVTVEGWQTTSIHGLLGRQGCPILGHHKHPLVSSCPCSCQPCPGLSCTPEQHQKLPSMSLPGAGQNLADAFSSEQHQSPYRSVLYDQPLPSHRRLRANEFSCEGTQGSTEMDWHPHERHNLRKSFPVSAVEASLMSDGFVSAPSFSPKRSKQQKNAGDDSF